MSLHRHLHKHPKQFQDPIEEATAASVAPLLVREAAKEEKDSVATVYSVVYVTASASFTGATAGYVTLGASDSTSNTKETSAATTKVKKTTQTVQPTKSTTSSTKKTSTSTKTTSSKTSSETSSTESSDSSSSSSSITSSQTTLATSTTSSDSSSSVHHTTAIADATSSSSATASSSPSDTGMSGGAKAGLAIGIILAIGLIAGAIFFVLRRKRRQQEEGSHEKLDDADEKNSHRMSDLHSGGAAGSIRSTRTGSTAPRLSLRPVTQFLPNLHGDKSGVAEIGAAGTFVPPSSKPANVHERQAAAQDPSNPFGHHAETVPETIPESAAEKITPPPPAVVATLNPFVESAAEPTPAQEPKDDAAAAGHQRNASVESAASGPSSPNKAEVATASAVAVGGAMGAATRPPQGPNNVYRVQLDFKPSMEDELELRAGSLVRMLHEYDDGWALCITMDRSKQGVTPRTCLSKLPVKPRPQGPPPNGRPMGPPPPGMRRPSNPPQPNGRMSPAPQSPMFPAPLSPSTTGRPMTPNQQRPMTPTQRPMTPTQAGRPMTPTQHRPMTPTQIQGRARSSTLNSTGPPRLGGVPVQRSRSPGPYNSAPKPQMDMRRRSNSMSMAVPAGATATTKPSPLNFSVPTGATPVKAVPARKPVPGQAL